MARFDKIRLGESFSEFRYRIGADTTRGILKTMPLDMLKTGDCFKFRWETVYEAKYMIIGRAEFIWIELLRSDGVKHCLANDIIVVSISLEEFENSPPPHEEMENAHYLLTERHIHI